VNSLMQYLSQHPILDIYTSKGLKQMSELSINTTRELLAYIKENLSNDKNLSIRGLERLCGIGRTALIKGGDFRSEKLGQTLIEHGFTAGDLVKNGFDAKACWLVIEYYAYESKAKAPGAKQFARTFGEIGLMTTFDKLTEVPTPQPLDVTQGLVNELHDAAKVVCYNDTLADMAINDSLDYQKKLNPMYEATVRVSLIRAALRLGKSPAKSMESRECTGTVNKQLRQTQDAMEGYDTVAPELRPKSELADVTRARELNPSSMEQGLFALTPLSREELQAAKKVDLSKIKNPTRYATIEHPKLPEGFVLDVPGIHY
jgi:hypothetical protein